MGLCYSCMSLLRFHGDIGLALRKDKIPVRALKSVMVRHRKAFPGSQRIGSPEKKKDRAALFVLRAVVRHVQRV